MNPYIQPKMAEQTAVSFITAYLAERNMEDACNLLDDDVQWIGTGCFPVAKNKMQAMYTLRQDIMLNPSGYKLSFSNTSEQLISDSCAMYTCLVNLFFSDGSLPPTPDVRMTLICRMTESGCKIASIFAAVPTALQGKKELFFGRMAEESPDSYDRRLWIRSLDLINKRVSGGIIGCYLAENLPFYYINEQAANYFGYKSQEHFINEIQGFFIHCVHPNDQAQLTQTILHSLNESDDCNVRFRIHKQDGSYLWVDLLPKKVTLDSGESICLGVIGDISAEVDAQEHLLAEQQETQLLSSMLQVSNHLLNIVLEHTSSCTFYYDPINHRIYNSRPTQSADQHYEHFSNPDALSNLVQSHLDPSSHSAFFSAFKRIHCGE